MTGSLAPPKATSNLRTAAGIFKLRIGIVIAITALAGIVVQPGDAPRIANSFALFLAVLISAASAGAFNQYYEWRYDCLMTRTRNRPFVTGALRRHPGWLALILALTAASVAIAWFAANALAAVFTFLGAFFYAIVYTVWLKRRTWWNIVIGGLAGSFAVLAGAAAVSPALSPQAWLLAIVLFLWTPPHFWSLAIAYRDDYASANVPMLPVVKGDGFAARAILAHTIVLVALSLGLVALGAGWVYFVAAAIGGAYFIQRAVVLARCPDRRNAMRCFHASLAQLSMVLVGVLLDAPLSG